MLHWIKTAVDTYILHSEHGNGYQWWSGPGSDLAYASILYTLLRKHNCYEKRCFRIGTHRSQLDQHIRCGRHHKGHKQHPNYEDAKKA